MVGYYLVQIYLFRVFIEKYNSIFFVYIGRIYFYIFILINLMSIESFVEYIGYK